MSYVWIIIGFTLLIKGADILVDGASSLARKWKVSDLVVGLTVVAFGTSTPELAVNVLSALKGTTDIAVGNILGSNIANILLILGISSAITPLAVSKGTVWKEIPLSLLAIVLLAIMANDQVIDRAQDSALTRTDGLVLLSFFIIFLYYSFSIAQQIDGMSQHVPAQTAGMLQAGSMVVFGLLGLTLGGKLIVDGAVSAAQALNVSTTLIALTVVAVGTSLPELATSVMAALKKNPEIAVGNIVGSNIFNIFFVLGITSVIKPIPFPHAVNFDIGVAVLASLLLFLFMFTGGKRKLDRWEGVVFCLCYVGYIVILLIRK